MIARIPLFLASFVVCLGTTIALEARAESEADPTGSWRWTNQETGQKDLLRLQKKRGERVVGAYHPGGTEESYEVLDGRMEGETLRCRLEIEVDGAPLKVEIDATVDDDQLDGTVKYRGDNGESGEFEWQAKRSVRIEDAVGKWQLEFTSPDGRDHRPVMDVTQKQNEVVVHMVNEEGRRPAKSSRFKNGELVATFEFDYDGQPLRATYRGTPRGYELNGVIEYELAGNTGEFEFHGTRKNEN